MWVMNINLQVSETNLWPEITHKSTTPFLLRTQDMQLMSVFFNLITAGVVT